MAVVEAQPRVGRVGYGPVQLLHAPLPDKQPRREKIGGDRLDALLRLVVNAHVTAPTPQIRVAEIPNAVVHEPEMALQRVLASYPRPADAVTTQRVVVRLRQEQQKLHPLIPLPPSKLVPGAAPSSEIAGLLTKPISPLERQLLVAHVGKKRRLHEHLLTKPLESAPSLEKMAPPDFRRAPLLPRPLSLFNKRGKVWPVRAEAVVLRREGSHTEIRSSKMISLFVPYELGKAGSHYRRAPKNHGCQAQAQDPRLDGRLRPRRFVF